MTYGSGSPLVVDTSAWARQHHDSIRERWRATATADLLASCPVVALELLTVAPSADEYDRLDLALRALRQAPVTTTVCAAALAASCSVVTAAQHRRVPAAHYLIAAAAAARGSAVLHYDHDYDALAGPLGIESVWIASPGTLP